MGKKAVFFDRDGTLIIDKHYLHDPNEVEFLADTISSLKMIRDKGYHLFMVTNQSGIGRGMFTEADMHRVHERILSDLAEENLLIEDVAFCPHSPDDECDCRKPAPKMILDLMKRHNIESGFMIGDKPIDAQAGIAAGIEGVHLTQGQSEYTKVKSLTEFAQGLP